MTITIRVNAPATTANLGPGYDCAGLSLGLHDELVAAFDESGDCYVEVTGEGAGVVPTDRDHLVVSAMDRVILAKQCRIPGVRLRCHNVIPHGRGLGSSSAAIVAGITIGREYLRRRHGVDVTDVEALELATEIEGHPDNVAPALLGGLTLTWADDQETVNVKRLVPVAELEPVVAIARSPLATHLARALLPAEVPHAVAAANSARSALLAVAFTQDPSLLLPATQDFLHQEARRHAYPDSYDLVCRLREDGVAAAISGAGPTVVAFGLGGTDWDGTAVERRMSDLSGARDAQFLVRQLDVDLAGVVAE